MARLTGDTRTFSLSHRVANGILLMVASVMAAATCANLAVGAQVGMVLIAALVSVVHIGLYLRSRVWRAHPGSSFASFLILVLGFYPAVWWANFGIAGGNHIIGVGLFALSAAQFSGWRRHTAAFLVVFMTAVVMAAEHQFPHAIAEYATPWAQFRDNFLTFFWMGAALYSLNWVTDRNYATEREKAHEYAAIVERTNRQLEEALEMNRMLANRDGLTGLPNRRYLEPLLAQQMEEAHRYRRPLTLAVLDIDHFKSVNDRHGHAVGDRIIAGIGKTMAEVIRTADVAARWGGEEFVVLYPETDIDGARTVSERLRSQVENTCYAEGVLVTISIGLAEVRKDDTAGTLFERADAALYDAKHNGRNRIEVARPPDADEKDGLSGVRASQASPGWTSLSPPKPVRTVHP